jgi:hypothetical protein
MLVMPKFMPEKAIQNHGRLQKNRRINISKQKYKQKGWMLHVVDTKIQQNTRHFTITLAND